MQRITDPPLSRCPTCRRKVRRLISSTSFQLKGTGWYATDYARPSGGNGTKTDAAKESSDKAETKSETKSETKPETKSESKPAASEKPAS